MAEGTRSLDAVNEDDIMYFAVENIGPTVERHTRHCCANCQYYDDKEMRIILVGEECRQNAELVDAVEKLDCDKFESETGYEYIADASEFDLVFVLSEFKGEVFDKLHKADVRIVGPPVILRCARDNLPIPYNSRPQYCFSMQGLKVCFTGFKEKADLCHFVDLVHYMAGNVRRDFKSNVTHLVANVIGGEKYEYAVGLGTPIMSRDWLNRVWTERDMIDFRADDSCVMKYKLAPFYKRCLSFLGFSKDEQNHMEEVTIENGGTFASVGDEECTHLIIDEAVTELPTDIILPKHVVKGEWFWACIQMEACAAEKMYTFQKGEPVLNLFTPSTNMSGTKSRKRKRLKENIAQMASDEELESPLYNKRRSSDMGGIISPNSFLDASNTPDISDININDKEVAKVTPRLQVVKEFLQTEKNYVGILHTLLNTFKSQIEKQDQYNGAILAAPDIKLIFGNIPSIYNIHCSIRDELTEMVENWNEEQQVGSVISKNADALVKAYPPFVNFFEDTKERIQKCDKSNPRFHAFLKVCQTKPECGRQTLTELLIRPVQRLPSITLLLNDILKHTNKTNPDYVLLEKANSVLKEVMTHINEDKRKTESQVVMFDIVKDIENCPATLLSSHRFFITRIDVIELSETLCERGAPLALFLFSDSVVICKRRTKVLNSKSPASTKTPQKGYKHIEFIPLQCVKRVLDIVETENCKDAFGLIVKNSGEMKEKLFTFMLDTEEMDKNNFITQVSKSIANTLCRTDHDSLIFTVEGDQLQVNTLDLGNQTFGKAASRFSRRVSRAFSFNKTPRRIKRAVSHVFSPFVKDNPREFTPGNLRGKRLASSIDLTEDSISLGNFYDDSDTLSLGAFSMKDPLD
ncbi:protein ECT2-like isoform X2 [Mercenaria mercenaria]|uniref:protein ECT2-like isoform X2 n=1 Tax=Mercenaria mercenaria TaxID=6596 RepID=UPI00234F2859|nr:protein ECT2-like isoform X2 [Mercenaria mercenaria]